MASGSAARPSYFPQARPVSQSGFERAPHPTFTRRVHPAQTVPLRAITQAKLRNRSATRTYTHRHPGTPTMHRCTNGLRDDLL
eukprot:11249246-Alexandrium_andersonii.AAC.1